MVLHSVLMNSKAYTLTRTKNPAKYQEFVIASTNFIDINIHCKIQAFLIVEACSMFVLYGGRASNADNPKCVILLWPGKQSNESYIFQKSFDREM